MVLNDRRLVATGTHRELMESNEFYRKLIETQMVPNKD
jgi:ABC-type multidrug transport system fused ATPase/permease subunit